MHHQVTPTHLSQQSYWNAPVHASAGMSASVPFKKHLAHSARAVTVGHDPHAAALYKTELCRSFSESGYCRYGLKCQFAHGLAELRPVQRHKKYKTEKCKNFSRDGVCPYGARCRFIHTSTDGVTIPTLGSGGTLGSGSSPMNSGSNSTGAHVLSLSSTQLLAREQHGGQEQDDVFGEVENDQDDGPHHEAAAAEMSLRANFAMSPGMWQAAMVASMASNNPEAFNALSPLNPLSFDPAALIQMASIFGFPPNFASLPGSFVNGSTGSSDVLSSPSSPSSAPKSSSSASVPASFYASGGPIQATQSNTQKSWVDYPNANVGRDDSYSDLSHSARHTSSNDDSTLSASLEDDQPSQPITGTSSADDNFAEEVVSPQPQLNVRSESDRPAPSRPIDTPTRSRMGPHSTGYLSSSLPSSFPFSHKPHVASSSTVFVSASPPLRPSRQAASPHSSPSSNFLEAFYSRSATTITESNSTNRDQRMDVKNGAGSGDKNYTFSLGPPASVAPSSQSFNNNESGHWSKTNHVGSPHNGQDGSFLQQQRASKIMSSKSDDEEDVRVDAGAPPSSAAPVSRHSSRSNSLSSGSPSQPSMSASSSNYSAFASSPLFSLPRSAPYHMPSVGQSSSSPNHHSAGSPNTPMSPIIKNAIGGAPNAFDAGINISIGSFNRDLNSGDNSSARGSMFSTSAGVANVLHNSSLSGTVASILSPSLSPFTTPSSALSSSNSSMTVSPLLSSTSISSPTLSSVSQSSVRSQQQPRVPPVPISSKSVTSSNAGGGSGANSQRMMAPPLLPPPSSSSSSSSSVSSPVPSSTSTASHSGADTPRATNKEKDDAENETKSGAEDDSSKSKRLPIFSSICVQDEKSLLSRMRSASLTDSENTQSGDPRNSRTESS